MNKTSQVGNSPSACLIALVTCPADSAESLARSIVDEQLAACVNTVPAIHSTYRWQGQVTVDSESLLLIKTTESRFDQLKSRVLELHPYELPEMIAVDLAGGHSPYLQWIVDSVSKP